MKAIFADVDDSLCLDPKSVKERITDRTRAVMYVGMGGNMGNYYDIVKICEENGLKLILDAAHMAGTRHGGGNSRKRGGGCGLFFPGSEKPSYG